MVDTNLRNIKGLFILGFGVCHFLFPFMFQPNQAFDIIFLGIQIANLVIPGSIILAFLSIVFYYFKDMYSMTVLAFMYLCGAVGHILFLLGIIPPLLIIPLDSALFLGAVLDIGTPIIILDYGRRHRKNKYRD